MAEFTTAKDSLIASMALASGSSSTASINDDFEDGCSICLEPFCLGDPATVTTCKHEYHLHCILEWSQRSEECPICWQSLALEDPASQELLAAVEIERNSRRKNVATNGPSHLYQYQESNSKDGSRWTGDRDFNDRIMQHLTAMMSRARQAHRNEGQISSDRSPFPVLMFPSSPPLSPTPSSVNLSSSSAPSRVVHQPSRPIQSQSPESTLRSRSPELSAFSDSIKYKFSAASARYKDKISKGTQGFREKLLARNNSVKELSKGVQREMSAGIAGVARMIERLELKYKRTSQSHEGLGHVGETSNSFSKGKGMLDHIIANSCDNHVVAVQNSELHEKVQSTCSISTHKDVSCAESV